MSNPDIDVDIDMGPDLDAEAIADAPLDTVPEIESTQAEDPIGLMPNAVVIPMAERIAEP